MDWQVGVASAALFPITWLFIGLEQWLRADVLEQLKAHKLKLGSKLLHADLLQRIEQIRQGV